MHICSSKVSNKYPILLQCNMNESNQKHNISEKAWEWDYTHFIFYKVLQKIHSRKNFLATNSDYIYQTKTRYGEKYCT